MIKVAMIRIQNRFEDLPLSTKMIMQVHDELVFEVPEEEIEKALPMIQDEMGEGDGALRSPQGLDPFGKKLGRGTLTKYSSEL